MGVVGTLLGDAHPLNLSNAIYGGVLYSLLAVLGNCHPNQIPLHTGVGVDPLHN